MVYKKPILVEVATVLLIGIALFELLLSSRLNSIVTLNFLLSLNKFLSSIIIFSSLLGVYGLLSGDRIGNRFAFLASIFELFSGSFLIIEAFYIKQSEFALVFLGSFTMILGFSCIFSLLRVRSDIKASQHILDSRSSLKVNEYAVEVIEVSKRYVMGPIIISAVNELSMKIPRGEFLAIMGPSGSGKSTLLNLIGALDRPSSGSILVDGVDISKLDDVKLAKLRNEKIGFIFQSYNLVDRSKVMRNMELPTIVMGYTKRERIKRIRNLLKMVGLDDKANRKPKTLSGGEQQRIAIARALVNEPKILLADEPTGNLDSNTGRDIMNFLRKMSSEKETTLIIVTHDREVAEMADRIINFRDGMIVNEERLKN